MIIGSGMPSSQSKMPRPMIHSPLVATERLILRKGAAIGHDGGPTMSAASWGFGMRAGKH